MEIIETHRHKFAEWASAQRLSPKKLAKQEAEYVDRAIHGFLNSKSAVRILCQDGPFQQSELGSPVSLSPKDSTMFVEKAERLMRDRTELVREFPLEIKDSTLNPLISSGLQSFSVQEAVGTLLNGAYGDYYLKPDNSALGDRVLRLVRQEDGDFMAIGLNNYTNNHNQAPLFSYLDQQLRLGKITKEKDNLDTFTIHIPKKQAVVVLEDIIGLHGLKGYFGDSLQIIQQTSVLEGTIDNLFTIEGCRYETRHRLTGDFSNGKVGKSISHMAKIGSSGHFGTMSGLKPSEEAKSLCGFETFSPLLERLSEREQKKLISSLEVNLRGLYKHIEERGRGIFPGLLENITGKTDLQVDLGWRELDSALVPCIIECHISVAQKRG